MKKVKIGVIFGGQSTEHDVSNVSGTSVIKNLNKERYDILPIYISKEGDWYKYTKDINNIEILNIGEQPKELEKIVNKIELLEKVNVVFPVLHGLYGEDGSIQGLLELLKLPYVGCGILASSICMNKIYAKIIFEKAGINQANSIIINTCNKSNEYIYIDKKLNHLPITIEKLCDLAKEELKYPVFVKPSNSGSSVGVNKACNDSELIKCIELAKKYDKEILIEEAINGKEVECAVIGNDDIKASCVGQILSADEFYDYESKYKNIQSKVVIPADIEIEVAEQIRKLAIKAFKAVHGKGLSRIDFFIDKETSEIYLNEINTMPGFTNISMYPKLWENGGIEYSGLLDELIELAMN